MKGGVPMLCSVDWQALATFSTGVMAVGAAVFIGRKQTAILASQGDVQMMTLQHQLFDRRLAVYNAYKVKLRDFIVKAKALSQEEYFEFLDAEQASGFLFESEVSDRLEQINGHIWHWSADAHQYSVLDPNTPDAIKERMKKLYEELSKFCQSEVDSLFDRYLALGRAKRN
jgi:hypothetical protein